MLLLLPRKFRSEDDDYAPVDYQFVPSVAEGERRRQATPIHQEEGKPSVRHRAEPDAPAQEGQRQSREARPGEPRGYEAARRLPRAGEAPEAASVAYPRPRDNHFAQSPAYTARPAQPLPPVTEADMRGYGSARSPRTFAPRVADEGRSPRFAADTPAGVASRGNGARAPLESASQPFPDAAYADRSDPDSPTPYPQTERKNAKAGTVPNEPYPQDALPQGRWGAPVQPGDTLMPDGSQYAQPSQQNMPDWLKMASHNHMPYDEEHRRQLPRVERAPQDVPASVPTDPLGRPLSRRNTPQMDATPRSTAEAYEAAGYPPELIAQQRYHDDQLATDPSAHRKRHGAQLAAPPPADSRRQAAAVRRSDAYGAAGKPRGGYAEGGYGAPPYPRESFAPPGEGDSQYAAPDARYSYGAVEYRVETVDERRARHAQMAQEPDMQEENGGEETPRPQIPWLGIAAFAAALLVVGLWIAQITFTGKTQAVVAARADAQQSLIAKHPYSYRELIEREAQENNLHPAFVAAIVLNESSFNPNAESDVGARGLMQMMPDTAQWVHDKLGLADPFSFDQMYDADTNVHYACWYLSYLSDRFRADPILVSAAFHAGQNTVQNWLNDSRYSSDRQTISLEKMAEGPTRNYATRVLKDFATYRRIYYEGGLEAAATAAAVTKSALSAASVSPGAAVAAAR